MRTSNTDSLWEFCLYIKPEEGRITYPTSGQQKKTSTRLLGKIRGPIRREKDISLFCSALTPAELLKLMDSSWWSHWYIEWWEISLGSLIFVPWNLWASMSLETCASSTGEQTEGNRVVSYIYTILHCKFACVSLRLNWPQRMVTKFWVTI